jgi:hypothetical protein
VRELLGVVCDIRAFRRVQVVDHAVVEGEHGSGCSDFGTHVANGGHARARKRLDTGTLVLDNSTGTALDREDSSDLQDNVYFWSVRGGYDKKSDITLGCCPAANFAREVHTNDLGAFKFPRNVRHNVDRIGTTDTASNHSQTTSVRGVRVSADHKSSGESVIFEDNLVNDTRAGFPEAESVLQ